MEHKNRTQQTAGEYDYSTEKGVNDTVKWTNEEDDAFVWVSGTVSTDDASPLKVGANFFNTEHGKIIVAPRFAFEEGKAIVVLGYESC